MAFKYHDIVGIGDIHIPHDLEYANQAARLAGAGLGSQHVGRLCKQLDDGSYWVLTQFTPSIEWAAFVPPAPVVGDIGKSLEVLTDGASGVKLDWTSTTSDTLDSAYNNSGGASTITVDAGDVSWNLTGAYSFNIDFSSITSSNVDGLIVVNGLDNFSILRQAANTIDIGANLRQFSAICSDICDFRAGSAFDFTFGARGGTITLNESGDTTLSGFTATSIIGALNELKGVVGSGTLDDAYNNDGGAATVTVDAGDVTWALSGAYSFVINCASAAASDGFEIVNGTDNFKLIATAANSLALNADLSFHTLNSSTSIAFTAATDLSLEASTAVTFATTPKITTDVAQNFNIVPGAGGITQIGDAGSTSHGMTTNDDLFVSGQLEVDATIWADGNIYLGDDRFIYNSATTYGAIQPRNTAQTVDTQAILFGDTSKYLLCCEYADRSFDFAHAAQTNPTIFLHSANQSTTEWISLAHDQTDGVISTGAGNIKLLPATGSITQIGDAGSTSRGLNTNDDLFVSGELEIDGTVYLDGLTQVAGSQTLKLLDDSKTAYGNSLDTQLLFNTDQTVNTFIVGVDGTSRSVIICDSADKTYDFNHTAQSNPTLIIHSANQSTSQWISVTHDSGNGRIDVGTGDIIFDSDARVKGTFLLEETTAPGATTSYGSLYVKSSDTNLYFKKSSGSEVQLTNGGAGIPTSYFRAYRGSTQNLPNTTETKIQFNTETYDNDADYDNATNYQFTAPEDGLYSFSTTLKVTLGAVGSCECRIYVNSTMIQSDSKYFPSAGTVFNHCSATTKLSASDTVEIRAYQGTGFAATIQATDTVFEGAEMYGI